MKYGKRRSKFGNKITIVDGIRFHSKKESERYKELCLLKKRKIVRDFACQVKYTLFEKNRAPKFPAMSYIADFVVNYPNGTQDVEDVKGVLTAIYKLKKRLMWEQHKILIKEIY